MNKEVQKLKPKITKVLKRYHATKAGIFGSYARGTAKKKSDVDILVELPTKLSLFDFIGIKLELEKVLKMKVDLVEYNSIKPVIKKGILTEEIRIL